MENNYQVGVLYPIKQIKQLRSTFYNTLVQRLFNIKPVDLKGNNTPFAINVMEMNYFEGLVVFEDYGFLDKLSTDYILSAMQRGVPVYVIRFKRTELKTVVKVYAVLDLRLRDGNLIRYSYITRVMEYHGNGSGVTGYDKLLLN